MNALGHGAGLHLIQVRQCKIDRAAALVTIVSTVADYLPSAGVIPN